MGLALYLRFAAFAFAAAGVFAAPAAQARTPVVVEGVDRDLRETLTDLLPDRDPPDTVFAAQRIAEEAAEIVSDYLRSEGWYGSAATPLAVRGEPPRAVVSVSVGERFTLARPELGFAETAPAEDAAGAARAALAALRVGAPARAEEVLAAEAAAVEALRLAGYPDAEARPRRVVVDHATRTLTATYALAPGERARLGALRVQPEGEVEPEIVARLQDWPEGALYSPRRIAATRRDFAGPGVFERVRVDLAEAANPDGTRDVIVAVDPGRERTIALGAAFSTLEGVGVDAEWTRRNGSERLETLTVGGRLAEREQRLSTGVSFPHALGRSRARLYNAELAREDLEPFERAGLRLSTAVENTARARLSTTYGLAVAADFYDARAGVENAYTLSGFGQARLDTADSPLDPRQGEIVVARLEPGVATGDATVSFARATLEGRIYRTVLEEERLTLAGRSEIGWVAALSGSDEDLPLDRRFYAGGGGSVRGYEFNSIYPQRRRVVDSPPGGQGLFEVAVEARYRVTERWGFATFLDAGSAFDEAEDATDLRYGAGVGVRYDLGFAPLRVDLAAPLSKRAGDEPFAIYVSLGQAF